jgi:hypothetical protein
MFRGVVNFGFLRDSDRRKRKPARRYALSLEGLEDRNLLSFAAPSAFHFSRDPQSVAVADFTRDGNQGLVVADESHTLTVLLGNGDGSFRSTGSFQGPGGGVPLVAAGDFNGDGIPDLVAATVDGVRVLRGNGDGSFRNAGDISLPIGENTDRSSIAVADLHGDGKQDLVVASNTEGLPEPVFELRGNGDGSFQSPVNLGFSSTFVVAGDINNDGTPDLVDLNSSGQAELRLGNGDGTFQDPVPFAPGLPLKVADVNGDGIPDLVFATRSGISERLGNGDGTFQDPVNVTFPANTPGTVLGVGDFNNDGQLDVVIGTRPFAGESHALGVLLNNGAGSFVTAPAYATGAFPNAVAAGDFTGSSLPDLVTVGFDGQAQVLLSNGDGTFRSGGSLSAPGVGTSVVVGDFDGDGKLDIATLSRDVNGHSQVNVFLGNGDGTFQADRIFDLGSDTASAFGKIVAGDFDRDGRLDLAVLFRNNFSRQNLVEVFLGNGDGTFRATEPQQVDTGGVGEASGLVSADFNGDGKLDLAVANQGNANGDGARVSVLLGNGDGSFQDPISIPVPGGPFQVAVGDFNGDGIPDLVTVNALTNTVSVLRGNGDGSFGAPVNYPVGVDPAALMVGDFNGDGIPDVAVANSVSNSVSVLRGNGDGTFQNAVDYLVGIDPRSLVAADFNGDGALDLAVANFHSDDISVLLNRGDGPGSAPSGPLAGVARVADAAAIDALFAGARSGPGSPVVVGQRPAAAAIDPAVAAGRPEAVIPPPAQQAVADAGTLPHRHQEDPAESAGATGLANRLAGGLPTVV